MSYAMGAVASTPPGQQIHVGPLAGQDPIMSAASLMASRLLVLSIGQPRDKRLDWLRRELNKSQPGLGNDAVSKVKELMRTGSTPNQALFDGLRLTLANIFAQKFAKIQGTVKLNQGVSGLGESVGDINATACLIMGTIGAGGATATSLLQNPAGSRSIGEVAVGVMGANSCNADAIRAQAEVIRAQAALAAAQGSLIPGTDNTIVYVGLGLGAVVLLLGGVFLLKK